MFHWVPKTAVTTLLSLSITLLPVFSHALTTNRMSVNLDNGTDFELTLEGNPPFTVTSTNPAVLKVEGGTSVVTNENSVTISGARPTGGQLPAGYWFRSNQWPFSWPWYNYSTLYQCNLYGSSAPEYQFPCTPPVLNLSHSFEMYQANIGPRIMVPYPPSDVSTFWFRFRIYGPWGGWTASNYHGGYNPNGSIVVSDSSDTLVLPGYGGFKMPEEAVLGNRSCDFRSGLKIPGNIGEPIDVTTGNMYYSAPVDGQVKGRTLSPAILRSYNSKGTDVGNFGLGWSNIFGMSLKSPNEEGDTLRVVGDDGQVHYFGHTTGDRYVGQFNDQSVLMGNDTTGYQWTSGDRIFHFMVDGRLSQIESLEGEALLISYDPVTGRIDEATLPSGQGFAFQTTTVASGGSNWPLITSMSLVDGLGGQTPLRQYEYLTGVGDNPLLTMVRDGTGDPIEEYIYNTEIQMILEIRRYVDPVNYVVVESHTYNNELKADSSEGAGGSKHLDLDYSVPGEVTATGSSGRTTIYHVNGYGEVTSIEGDSCSECGAGDYANYTYNMSLNITSTVDRKGVQSQRTYDNRGNMLTLTEAVGLPEQRTTTYEYHPDYDLVTGETSESVLSPGNNRVITNDYHNAQGNTTPYLYKVIEGGYTKDTSGATVSFNYETQYSYNLFGQVTTIDGPRTDVTDVTAFTYDSLTGDLLTVTDPAGNATTFGNYDLRGNPGTITDANSVSTAFSYDGEGRILSVTRAGETTVYSYYFLAGSDLLSSINLPGGNVLSFGYDDALNLASITDSSGNAIAYSYDSEGNRTYEEVRDTGSVLRRDVSYVYDTLDRLWKIYTPSGAGTFTEFGYDANGNRDLAVSPDSRRVDYGFDALNRLDSAVREMGAVDETTGYVYDNHDNLTAVTDANGNTTYYTYDDAGRQVLTDSPDTGVTAYNYDPAGNLTRKVDARGIETLYAYDAANRLIQVSYPSDPALTVTYEYDLPSSTNGYGRLCRMTDASGETVYHYDASGRVTDEVHTIVGIAYTTSYSYNADGSLASVTYPTGRIVTYNRDVTGALTSATADLAGDVDTLVSSTVPHPFGGYDSITYGNGVVNDFGFDLAGRLESLASGAFLSRTYQRMAGGDIYAINDLVNPTDDLSYNYDLAGRLTFGSGPFSSVSYTYDGVGNRLNKTTGAGSTAYAYITGTNRLDTATGAEASTFTHDLAGNMNADGGYSMVYDAAGRLAEINEAGTLKGRYFYNGQGQRAIKDECRVFVYDLSGNIIGEYMTDGTLVAETVYADGMRLAEYRDVNVDPVCTPYQDPPGPAEGYILSNNSGFDPDMRDFFNTEMFYSLVWSDQIDETQVTESTARLSGAKGQKANYTLTWDPALWGWTGSVDLATLDLNKGGNSWTWTATITDALGGSYTPSDTITVTEGGAAMAFVPLAGGGAKAPVVNSVVPDTGSTSGGETVTVNGRNFVATPSVQFGTAYSPSVTFVSDKVLSVETPAYSSGTVDLTVINPDLQSDVLTNGFTFVFSGPPPVITSVDPDTGDITGGDTVTVHGTDFVDGASVSFDGADSPSVTFVSSTTLTVVTPVHAEGVVDVTVTNPDLASDTLPVGFTYVDLTGLPDYRLHYFHGDHLGTPLYQTDSLGVVVWEGKMYPFGDVFSQNTDPDGDGSNVYQPFRFPGQYEDSETGLYYNYFRDYNPSLGRYVEADPIGLAGGDLSLMSYVGQNPVNWVDPDGLLNIPFGGNKKIEVGIMEEVEANYPGQFTDNEKKILARELRKEMTLGEGNTIRNSNSVDEQENILSEILERIKMKKEGKLSKEERKLLEKIDLLFEKGNISCP